jgi:hypothetical protein
MNNKRTYGPSARLLLIIAALCLSMVPFASSQSTTDGAIGGTVFDQTGAVIPNATVVIHNDGTNLDQTLTTDTSGSFRALKLTPAAYTVTIKAAGFQTFKAEKVIVTVGSLTNVSPRMQVGGSQETVSVSWETPEINLASADLSSTVNQTAVESLPIQRARWSAFAVLTPGVVHDSSGFGLLSFRGMSTLLNNNTIDGADDNQAFFSEQRGRTRASYSTTQAAVQEFQVNTSNYSAEYGRAAGGVINAVTKSGTNQFHGELSYKNRENGWAARNPFSTITIPNGSGGFSSVPFKPKDYWHVWDIGVGGPIIKDKLFFFFAYDGFYRNFPGNAIASSPSVFFATPVSAANLAAAGGTCAAANNKSAGVLSGVTSSSAVFGNNTNVYNATLGACAIAGVVVQGTSTPVSYATGAQKYIDGLTGLTTMLGGNDRTGKQSIFFPKIDWQVNAKNRATFEVNRMRWSSPYGVQTQATNSYSRGSAFGNDYVKNTWGVAKLVSFLTTKISNEVRYQVGRDFEFETSPPATDYEVNVLQRTTTTSSQYPSWSNYTNPYGYPTYVTITNGFNFGTPYYNLRYAYPDEWRHQIADTVTWMHGKHTMKFGMDYSRVSDQILNIYQQVGQFGYSSVSNYLQDLYAPAACNGLPCKSNYSSFAQGFGPLGYSIATHDVALFAQDDWKILPRLTLSLGLRWEYEKLPEPLYPNPAVPNTAKLPDPKKNFGPRVGFAWDVTGDGKTALRGGVGIYYGRITNGIVYAALTQTGLVKDGVLTGQPSYSFSSASATGGPYFPTVLPSMPTSTAAPAIMYFNPSFKNPQIDEVDLVLERNLGWNTVLGVSYMGSFGHFLPQYTDDNMRPGTNAAGAGSTISYRVAGGGPLKDPTYSTVFYAYRPNSSYAQMLNIFGVNSNYNAMSIQVAHRMAKSVQFNAHFTWAHSLDFGASSATNLTASSGFNMFRPDNIGLEYGNSSVNVPRRFVFNMVLNSPWKMKGKLGYLTDGWQIAPIFTAQDGLPYSIGTSGNAPGRLTNGSGMNGSAGRFGIDILGRNTFKMRGSQNLDVRVSKSFNFMEKAKLELMAEAFNLFNHFNTQSVSTTGYSVTTSGTITDTTGAVQSCSNSTPCLSYSTAFGTVTAANSTYAYWTRQIQIGARLKF